MPIIKPFRLHRTWHLGTMLDALQEKRQLVWKYDYDTERRQALFTITEPGQRGRTLRTREAEQVAQTLTNKLQIVWEPVAHPGGEDQWKHTVARIEMMEQGDLAKPWE